MKQIALQAVRDALPLSSVSVPARRGTWAHDTQRFRLVRCANGKATRVCDGHDFVEAPMGVN